MIQVTLPQILRVLGRGALETLKLLPFCIIFSLSGGIVLGAIMARRLPVLSQMLSFYVVFMRGVPPLVVLYVIFFTAGLRSATVAAILGLSIYHTAYVADIVRGGILAIPKGQFEAAKSLALSSSQIMLRVIIPQVWYAILPALTGQYIILVKDTALTSAIGVRGILWAGQQLMNLTGQPFLLYSLVGIFYYVVCYLFERMTFYLERLVRIKVNPSWRQS